MAACAGRMRGAGNEVLTSRRLGSLRDRGSALTSAPRAPEDAPMTLSIDMSRPVRGLAAQVRLIEAVLTAPAAEPETDYIEWKSTTDIRDKEWRVTAARHILGFSNRSPSSSSTWFEGCAYLVFGCEPNGLHASPVYDPADVDKWVAEYVGDDPDAPLWSFDYVAVQGQPVLLFTVERPKEGDTIHTLRKDWTPAAGTRWRDGEVFIRKRGRTEQADTGDYQMLLARARSAPTGLGLDVQLRSGDEVGCVETSAESIQSWLDQERQSLMKGVSARNPAAFGVGAVFLDQRTVEQFQGQVARYVERAELVLPQEIRREAIDRGLGEVIFRIQNHGDDNFREVIVELSVDTPVVEAYWYSGDVDGNAMPSRPLPWGESPLTRPMIPRIDTSSISSIRQPRPHIFYNDSGELMIELPPVEVRPHSTRELESFHIFVPAPLAGTELKVKWRLTAAGQRGHQLGEVTVPVHTAAIPASEIVPHPKR